MGCLTKEVILAVNDIQMEKVFVPEWAEGDPEAYVMVKALTAKEQDEFDKTIMDTSNPGKPIMNMSNYRAKRAAFCMCDDAGNLLFAPEDIPNLSAKSSKALQRVLEADTKLNGSGVDILEKNYVTVQSENSPTN